MFTMSFNDSQAVGEGHNKAVVCDTAMSTSLSRIVLTTGADLTVNVVEEHQNQVVEESSEEEQPQQHLTSSSLPTLSSSTSVHHHPLTLDQLRIMIKDPILLPAASNTPGDDSLVLSSHILLSSALGGGVDDDNRPLSTTSCPGSDDAMIGSDIGAGGPRSSSPPASLTSLASNQSTIVGKNKSTNQVSTSPTSTTSSNSESSSPPSAGMSFDSHTTHPLPFETTSVIGDEEVMEEKEVEDEGVQSPSSQPLLGKHLFITSVPTTTGMETSLSSSDSPDSASSSFLSALSSEEPGNEKRKRVESESSNLSSTTTMSSTTTTNSSNVVAVSLAGLPSVPKENKNKKRKTASRSTTASSSSPPVTSSSSTPLSVQSAQPQQFFTQHTVVSSSSLSAPSLAVVSVISNAPNTATLASLTPPPPVGKSSKSSAKGMGCGRPGYITCSICSATKYYSHVQRRFGQFACEPCSKFMKRFLRDPKKFTCYEAGNCLIGRPSGEQEPRGVSVSRCKACWLKICLEKFVVEPAIKEVIQQHYLPVFLNGKGGAEVPVGAPALPSLSTTSPSSLPGYDHRAHSLPSHSSSLGVVNHSSHTTFASSIPSAVLTNALSSHHSLPPPLPLPSRKRKVKDSLPPAVVIDSTSHPSIPLSNTSVSTIGCGLSASYLTTTSSPLHDILTSPSKTTRTSSCSFQASQSLQNSVKNPRSPRKNPSTVKYKKVEPKSPGGKGGGKGTTTTTASKAGRGRKSAGGKFGVNDFPSSSSTLPTPPSSSVVVEGVHSRETQATTDVVVKRQHDGDENHSSVLSISHFTSPTTVRSRCSGKGTKTAGRRGRANTNTSSSSNLMENEPRAKFAPIKGRKGRKGKGYLHGFGYNHDHDYGSLPVQFMEEDDVHDEDDIADNVVGDVVIIKTESDAIPAHYKSSVVVLRESNEDHSEMRGRGASFSHLRNHPESPKAGTRAEDSSLSPDSIDTNFYSSTTDLISSTEEVMMREFNHPHHSLSASFVITSSSSLTSNTSTPNISGKGKRRRGGSTSRVKSAGTGRSKKSTCLTSRSSSFIGLGKRAGLNQENQKFSPSRSPNRRNRNSTITSPFADSKFSRTTEEYDDLMSTFDDVHSSSLHSHSSKHHHPSSTSSHFTTPRDDDSDEEADDDLVHRGGDDDDEGYDDYFDPVSIRDAIGTRDSLFFDEILNTNSPFL